MGQGRWNHAAIWRMKPKSSSTMSTVGSWWSITIMGKLLCIRLITIIHDDLKTIYFKMILGAIPDSTTWKKHQQRIGQIIQESIVYSEKFRSGRLSKPVFSHFREKCCIALQEDWDFLPLDHQNSRKEWFILELSKRKCVECGVYSLLKCEK